MIKGYFNLREEPFGVTPDPRFLYFTPSHREALASLYYGIQAGRGFMGLIAPPGLGKTTLLFHLLSKLHGGSVRPIYIFQSHCDSSQLLRCILQDLGLRPGADLATMQQQINTVMVNEFRLGRQLLLVVDEAHNLEAPVLESLRLLSNFETPRAKMLQIIIAGQPQLAATLLAPGILQLKQRLAQVARIVPLNRRECGEYVAQRLAIAGHSGDPLFTDSAIDLVFEHSGGVPRIINHLCFNALSICVGQRLRSAGPEVVQEVIADQDLSSLVPQSEGATVAAPPLVADTNIAPTVELVAELKQRLPQSEPQKPLVPLEIKPADLDIVMQPVVAVAAEQDLSSSPQSEGATVAATPLVADANAASTVALVADANLLATIELVADANFVPTVELVDEPEQHLPKTAQETAKPKAAAPTAPVPLEVKPAELNIAVQPAAVVAHQESSSLLPQSAASAAAAPPLVADTNIAPTVELVADANLLPTIELVADTKDVAAAMELIAELRQHLPKTAQETAKPKAAAPTAPVPLEVKPAELNIAVQPAAVAAHHESSSLLPQSAASAAAAPPLVADTKDVAAAMELIAELRQQLSKAAQETAKPKVAAPTAPVPLARDSFQYLRPVYLPDADRRPTAPIHFGRLVFRFAAGMALLAFLWLGYVVALDGKLPLPPSDLAESWRHLIGMRASLAPEQPSSDVSSNLKDFGRQKTRQHIRGSEGSSGPAAPRLPQSSKRLSPTEVQLADDPAPRGELRHDAGEASVAKKPI